MKTKLLMSVVMLSALVAFATPPEKGGKGEKGGKWGEGREERMEDRAREMHLMYVVAISEALELNEAEAIKLSDKLKGVEEKRKPLRQQMGEAMKALRDASDGDATALPQVDANVQRVLDGRAQMAALDKELFATLSQGLQPQKRAKLALVLAKLGHERRGGKKGRHHQRR